MKPRYLTKSRFKLAMECPTKLYYTGKKNYVDKSIEDSFLESLAEGGFQIGELAKLYYPGGHEIKTLDYEKALDETNRLLEEDQVIIYEAALRFGSLFVRVDILKKDGEEIELIEVKSKSIGPSESLLGKRGGILSEWLPYVRDVAFQKYVAKRALPHMEVSSYLYLVDKGALCPTDGLGHKFRIVTDEYGEKKVEVSEDISEEDLSIELLRLVDADEASEVVYSSEYIYEGEVLDFGGYLDVLANLYSEDKKSFPVIKAECGKCQFRASKEEEALGLRSGYKECFVEALDWPEENFEEDTIFDLWTLHYKTRDKLISQERLLIDQLDEEDFKVVPGEEPGLSASERRWLQVDKYKNRDESFWIDKEGLKEEMDSWTYPLHFIDFETAQPVIPFNKGQTPYAKIAFQFSHHLVHEDGRVEHKGEFITTRSDKTANFDFVRALKKELDGDKGTIFKYSDHENSYLNAIYDQLQEEDVVLEDKEELSAFIREITQYGYGVGRVEGPRNMVDMLELVKSYYYDPYMKGSNSIKVVLPAVLNSSSYLREKYSKPIYGSFEGIKSLNFQDWIWIKEDDQGKVEDPYKLLPKLFSDLSDEDYLMAGLDEELRDGGAAMMAYYKLQFEDISDETKTSIIEGLLRYCELDTLAMVMIYEAWREMVK